MENDKLKQLCDIALVLNPVKSLERNDVRLTVLEILVAEKLGISGFELLGTARLHDGGILFDNLRYWEILMERTGFKYTYIHDFEKKVHNPRTRYTVMKVINDCYDLVSTHSHLVTSELIENTTMDVARYLRRVCLQDFIDSNVKLHEFHTNLVSPIIEMVFATNLTEPNPVDKVSIDELSKLPGTKVTEPVAVEKEVKGKRKYTPRKSKGGQLDPITSDIVPGIPGDTKPANEGPPIFCTTSLVNKPKATPAEPPAPVRGIPGERNEVITEVDVSSPDAELPQPPTIGTAQELHEETVGFGRASGRINSRANRIKQLSKHPSVFLSLNPQ